MRKESRKGQKGIGAAKEARRKGGSCHDLPEATIALYRDRSKSCRLRCQSTRFPTISFGSRKKPSIVTKTSSH